MQTENSLKGSLGGHKVLTRQGRGTPREGHTKGGDREGTGRDGHTKGGDKEGKIRC